jgi:hypothetical protein
MSRMREQILELEDAQERLTWRHPDFKRDDIQRIVSTVLTTIGERLAGLGSNGLEIYSLGTFGIGLNIEADFLTFRQ